MAFPQTAPIKVLRITFAGVIASLIVMTAAVASDTRDEFPPIFTLSPTGVNIQTGKFTRSSTDLVIGPLKFVRSWNAISSFLQGDDPDVGFQDFGYWRNNISQGARTGVNGNTFVIKVSVDGQTFTFLYGGGNYNGYTAQFSPDLVSQGEQIGNKLEEIAGQLVFTSRKGDVYTFVSHPALTSGFTNGYMQVLQSIKYIDGSMTDFSYDVNGRPHVVLNSRGYALVIDYNAQKAISAVCGFNTTNVTVDGGSTCASAALKVGYTYVAVGNYTGLGGVTDVMGNLIAISYSVLGYGRSPILVTCITLPASSTCDVLNSYGVQPGETGAGSLADQVRVQTTPTGDIWRYDYSPPEVFELPRQPGEQRLTASLMTDPTGAATNAEYINGYVRRIDTPTGSTTYTFNGTVPVLVTQALGNSTEFVYDNRKFVYARKIHAVPSSGLPDLTASYDYPAGDHPFAPMGCVPNYPKLCNKPLYRIDDRGNRTDYAYDPAHGGILTETGPAVDGIRPQTRYTYVQRSAWVRSGGSYVAAPPIWVLAQTSICKTGAASGGGCATGGDEVVTTFDYGPDSGPNNLNLRGKVEDATGAALRTCYGFDWQGNKISETKPRAGLPSCP